MAYKKVLTKLIPRAITVKQAAELCYCNAPSILMAIARKQLDHGYANEFYHGKENRNKRMARGTKVVICNAKWDRYYARRQEQLIPIKKRKFYIQNIPSQDATV